MEIIYVASELHAPLAKECNVPHLGTRSPLTPSQEWWPPRRSYHHRRYWWRTFPPCCHTYLSRIQRALFLKMGKCLVLFTRPHPTQGPPRCRRSSRTSWPARRRRRVLISPFQFTGWFVPRSSADWNEPKMSLRRRTLLLRVPTIYK